FDPAVTAITGIESEGRATDIIPERAFTPTSGEQKVGFITEQIAEFLIPATKITQAGRAAQAAIGGTSRLAKAGGFATRSAIEGAGQASVAAVQGGDTITAGALVAAVPTVGKIFGAL